MDIGKNFISQEFNQYTAVIGTRIKIISIKAYNLVGIVKRYYSLIRRVYLIIIAEIPDINRDIGL